MYSVRKSKKNYTVGLRKLNKQAGKHALKLVGRERSSSTAVESELFLEFVFLFVSLEEGEPMKAQLCFRVSITWFRPTFRCFVNSH